jgi:hypothetical protein
MLEALVPCPHCGTRNAVPAIPPFAWWHRIAGVRCYSCRRRFRLDP